VTDAAFNQQADWVDLTDAADSTKSGVAGAVEKSFSVTVTGTSTITVGATGAAIITWNDGTTSGSTSDTYTCVSSASAGGVGGAVKTTLGFNRN
jgi:ribosomal protein L23